ncbi:hypothetical protein H257_07919 [Aphanomyces astaci]|uniref:PPPDE domain-containing protein n=1 Tax=Aphanomyces astaci TaxID=112090 RepID=W4GH92_APHAT|nr:hypothetical protein H257_07919 [Aphanomyces astaci]ETV78338.1 hypothetical protein H257_07919 [Aphanomyces astaci]|eukprot:XP_009831919.1 hypothetical protein H257_07919 [Aphanomyces astaci]
MYEVVLHVYDLTRGMARQMSPALLGRQIEGVWHTGVFVYEKEYFFGGGIQAIPPEYVVETYGSPVQVLRLGTTQVPHEAFMAFLQDVSPRFTAASYNLLTNNCNNFSNEVVNFLVGTSIPQHILDLPNEVLSTPMGAMFRPMIEQMQANMAVNVQSHCGGNPLPSFPAPSFLTAPSHVAARQPTAAAATVVPKSLDSYTRPLICGDPALHVDRILSHVSAVHSLSSEDLAAFQRLAAYAKATSPPSPLPDDDRSMWWPALLRLLRQTTSNNSHPFMALCLVRVVVLVAEVAPAATPPPPDAASVVALLVDHVDQPSAETFSSALRIVYLSLLATILATPSAAALLAPHALRFLPFVWSTWHRLPRSHPAAAVASAIVFNFAQTVDLALDWTVQFTVVGGVAETLDMYATSSVELSTHDQEAVERLVAALGRLLRQVPSARALAVEVGLVHVLTRLKPKVAATHGALTAQVLGLI